MKNNDKRKSKIYDDNNSNLETKLFSVKEFINIIKNDLKNTKTVEVFRYNKNIIEEYDDFEKENHFTAYENEYLFKYISKENKKSSVDSNMEKEIFNQLKFISSKLVEIDERLNKIEIRLDKVEQRLDRVEQRLDKVEQRLDVLEKDVKILKDDVAAIKKCPTIKKELLMVQ